MNRTELLDTLAVLTDAELDALITEARGGDTDPIREFARALFATVDSKETGK